jgi:cation transport regulator ChaC
MFNYFAYGSVLSLAHAREWCASHALDVAPFLAGEPARLDGYRLVFDVPSRFWAGLVADLVPDPTAFVEGVVFAIDDATRIAVERKEGVATGLYREHEEDVHVGDRVVRASVFSAVPERRVAVGPGSQRYVEALVEGAKERGLSPAWQGVVANLGKDLGRPPPPGVSLGFKKH